MLLTPKQPANHRGRFVRRLCATLALGALIGTGSVAVHLASAPTAASAAGTIAPDFPLDSQGTTLGSITSIAQAGSTVTLTAQRGAIRVSFLDDTTMRIEADPSGTFTDPANTPQNDASRTANIVVGATNFSGTTVNVHDADTITVQSPAITLRIAKTSGTMTLVRADGSVVWEEASPLSFGSASTTQSLHRANGEQFIGGGMQNGRSVHTDETINIKRDYNWEDGGSPNAVPYYMSSAGYGVLRNTFEPGSYTFTGTTTTTHAEKRFDAYYFVGNYKSSLNSYTKLTGRPMMPAAYMLEYGDADCYNRSNPTYSNTSPPNPAIPKQVTHDAVTTAKAFADNNMPGGWMLVNDGYGCEYTPDPSPMDPQNPGTGLTGTVRDIKAQSGMQTGLWTQRSLTNQQYEVGTAGIAIRKLDVAWIGAGYRMALTGCESAKGGIEQYSNKRGMALMVEGWAGSQRCGMQWTGDHTGTVEAIKWQIPAIAGSGNSGLAFTTADVDGIFGGSTESYIRDLQWKAFAPALYSMSGWSSIDKRPWLYGDAATQINRNYLQLRQKLMPYIYSLSANAHATGVSPVRSMPLEFPTDQRSYTANAEQQFMLGENLLVAPVSAKTTIRNGIELPAGNTWVNYWNGALTAGGQTINGYDAPIQTVPVYVKAGAIIPQGIVARNASLVPEDAPITLDVYPSGRSEFKLYEDDKVTREYATGASTSQTFTVTAPAKKAGDVTITVGKRTGSYTGMANARLYEVSAHTGSRPSSVTVDGTTVAALTDATAFASASSGWFYEDVQGGIVRVKTAQVANTAGAEIVLHDSSAVGGRDSDSTAAELRVDLPARGSAGDAIEVKTTFTNTGDTAKSNVTITPDLPAGWSVQHSDAAVFASVAPGAAVTNTAMLVPAASAGGETTVRASATYSASDGTHTLSAANQIALAFGSIKGAFNWVSTTSVAGKALGNFDNGGASFSLERLAVAPTPVGGVRPGSTVTVDAGKDTQVNYTFPDVGGDVPNSVALTGQTISVKGKGTHLAVLSSAAAGDGASTELTITYKDGTVQKGSFYTPNWLIGSRGLQSAKLAITSLGRNSASGSSPEYTTYPYQIYSSTVRLIPNKELASVTLPTTSRVRIFDWQLVDFPLPKAPSADIFASDLAWVSASNGYGVIGKDVANKDAATAPDLPLAVNYVDPATGKNPTYSKGLGVHAASNVTYYLGGQCSRFTSSVGLEANFGGNIVFTVAGDGRGLYQSRTFTPGFAPEQVSVDVTGVQYIELKVDPTTSSINGAHGVWGDAHFTCSPPDTQAPVSTITVTPTVTSTGWFRESPTVTLSAKDNVGVAATQITKDGTTWQPYTSPLTFTDGTTTLGYRSIDTAGNVELARIITLQVDTVAPTLTGEATNRSVVLTAADATSGVGAVEYSTDGGSLWQAYSGAIAAGADGVVVSARATDVAGNVTTLATPIVVAPLSVEPWAKVTITSATVKQGGKLEATVSGLKPGQQVSAVLHSDPIMATNIAPANDQGVTHIAIDVPQNLSPGAHTLVVSAPGFDSISVPLTIEVGDSAEPETVTPGSPSAGTSQPGGHTTDGSATRPRLASTGTEAPIGFVLLALPLLAAGVVILAIRRRREHS